MALDLNGEYLFGSSKLAFSSTNYILASGFVRNLTFFLICSPDLHLVLFARQGCLYQNY